MTSLLAYRGPDGEAVWTSPSGRCVLGHRRLSIIDLTDAGRQPMVDDELGLALTYNGEIYNYIELRERLRALGHTFRTQSDTEVLLRAYVEWGEQCVRELNGMFAFGIWNEKDRSLFLARDRFGEKPLVYALLPDAIAFASEAKALALVRGVDTRVDDGVLAAHVDDGSTWLDASERTLVRGIKQLLPSYAMRVTFGGDAAPHVRTWRYWSVSTSARHTYGRDDSTRAATDLRELLADSVRLRLRSDVPVGSCLSGGLDSSAIVALMRRLEPSADLRTFTGRFPGDARDEGHYAKLVVDASHTLHREVSPTPERFAREAERVYWHADFPIGGLSQFAQWCVFHLASEHGVTVLLDGQGSDEQLGGYGSGITAAFLSQIAAEGRWSAWGHERRAAARANPKLFSWPRLALNLPGVRGIRPQLRRATNRSVVARADLFRPEWVDAARRERPVADDVANAEGENALSRTLWMLSFRTMLSSLLRFGDRLSMAHSREVRLPFCDYRVAELAFSLSPELLVGEGEVKVVLRNAIDGLVPPAIVHRPKQGFVPPQESWLVGPLAGWVRDVVEAPGPIADLLDRSRVASMVRAPEAERTRDAVGIWEIANLAAWSRYSLASMQAASRHDASCGVASAA